MINPVLASDERGDNATKIKSLKVENNKAGLGRSPSTYKNNKNNNKLVHLHITNVLLDATNNTQVGRALEKHADTLEGLLDLIRTLFLLWQGAVYLLLNVHYPCVVQP